MRDKIFIEGLKIPCVIGIFDWERRTRQTILIDLDLTTDIRKAAKSDHIKDAVDYMSIAKFILAYVRQSRFYLIETLAERLAASLLKQFQLQEIRLRVSKPGALRHSKNVGIEILRRA